MQLKFNVMKFYINLNKQIFYLDTYRLCSTAYKQTFTFFSSAIQVMKFEKLWSRGGEHFYYHGPHEMCIITGGPQNQLIIIPLSNYEEE